MSTAVKTGKQTQCVIEEVLEQRPVTGSHYIRLYAAISDSKAATALAVDLVTHFLGSVRCAVLTWALTVNDVFKEETVRRKYLQHVNKATRHFNYH